jgi:hypothetical protein
MTKAQCEAIISALQKAGEYLANVQYKLGTGQVMGIAPVTVLDDLNTTFESDIATIISNIPDDPEEVEQEP